ncbi:hypothetical protein Q7C36_023087 [Tachysurus vachellii]|uniref:Uncharacterized protein n=1 Tax=Tachysurus vachellii TaxID=175792 RepID=A0AA88ILQ3_TACVA|nr:hypothetical protein Q7C36_023087 [Tachysurus vachellii]
MHGVTSKEAGISALDIAEHRHYGECGQSQESGPNTGHFAVLPEQEGIQGGENVIRPLLSSRPMNQITYRSLPEAFSCCCLG